MSLPETDETVYFDGELRPNRSLSPRAFTLVMAIVAAVSFIAGLSFMARGAFPVIGFFGLDVLIIWIAFQWSFRDLRQETRIRVTGSSIDLHHTRPGHADRSASVPTAFARLELAFPDRKPSELRLHHAGKAFVIGRFLTPRERVKLKAALETAISKARAERYAS